MSDGAARVRKHREKMKAAGLKPVTIWVPDINAPGFADDVRQQCLDLRNDPHEREILAELDNLRDETGWA